MYCPCSGPIGFHRFFRTSLQTKNSTNGARWVPGRHGFRSRSCDQNPCWWWKCGGNMDCGSRLAIIIDSTKCILVDSMDNSKDTVVSQNWFWNILNRGLPLENLRGITHQQRNIYSIKTPVDWLEVILSDIYIYKMIIIHELRIPSKQTRSRDLLLVELWYRWVFETLHTGCFFPETPRRRGVRRGSTSCRCGRTSSWTLGRDGLHPVVSSWIRWTSMRLSKNKDQ